MTEPRLLTFGSCFAGCGGLDLGLKMAGMRPRWWLEIDDDARDVLAEREPDVGRWDNIKTFLSDTASERRGAWGQGRVAARRQRRSESAWAARWRVDVVAGGFPCQDISYAGKGAGLDGKRSGLWHELARVVRVLRPRYVLLENVAALLTRGLDAVLGTLVSHGYVGEWTCLQAADLGASHLRDRIFIIGHLADPEGWRGQQDEPERVDERQGPLKRGGRTQPGAIDRGEGGEASEGIGFGGTTSAQVSGGLADADRQWESQQEGAFGEVWRRFGDGGQVVSDADLSRLAVGQIFGGDAGQELAALKRGNRGPGGCWEFDPADVPESGLGRMVDGISYRLHKGRARNKMLGNAVPPPVGEYLGRRIIKHHHTNG